MRVSHLSIFPKLRISAALLLCMGRVCVPPSQLRSLLKQTTKQRRRDGHRKLVNNSILFQRGKIPCSCAGLCVAFVLLLRKTGGSLTEANKHTLPGYIFVPPLPVTQGAAPRRCCGAILVLGRYLQSLATLQNIKQARKKWRRKAE